MPTRWNGWWERYPIFFFWNPFIPWSQELLSFMVSRRFGWNLTNSCHVRHWAKCFKRADSLHIISPACARTTADHSDQGHSHNRSCLNQFGFHAESHRLSLSMFEYVWAEFSKFERPGLEWICITIWPFGTCRVLFDPLLHVCDLVGWLMWPQDAPQCIPRNSKVSHGYIHEWRAMRGKLTHGFAWIQTISDQIQQPHDSICS